MFKLRRVQKVLRTVGLFIFSLTLEPSGEGTGTQLTGTGNQLIPYLGTNLLELLFDLLV